MDNFKWVKGRANDSGYQKMLLFQSERFKIDCYILKYPTGSWLTWHLDPVQEGRHFRFNWCFWKAKEGGVCGYSEPEDLADWKERRFRAYFFRPDITWHRVTQVLKGTRYVLSIGWVKK